MIRMADEWVRLSGILAVLLGLKTAFWSVLTRSGHHDELLWAAASIAVASAACAIMAVWRRKEGWAFSAALGVNLFANEPQQGRLAAAVATDEAGLPTGVDLQVERVEHGCVGGIVIKPHAF